MTTGGVTLVAPDGGDSKMIGDTSWLVYGWDRTGEKILGPKRTADWQTVIASIDIAKGGGKSLANPRGGRIPPFLLRDWPPMRRAFSRQ